MIESLIVLAGSITWVVGALYQKNKISSVSTGITNTVMQLAAASIVSFVIALCRGEWSSFDFDEVSLAAWGGIAYLTIMGTLVAYTAFLWLLKVRPPALVSTHTLINPIIAVFMGWLVLNEFVSGFQLFALAITLAGIFLIW